MAGAGPTPLLGPLLPHKRRFKALGVAALAALVAYSAHTYAQQQRRAKRRAADKRWVGGWYCMWVVVGCAAAALIARRSRPDTRQPSNPA